MVGRKPETGALVGRLLQAKGDKTLKTWEHYEGTDVVDTTRKELTKTG